MKLFCAFSTVAKLAALCFALGLMGGLYLGSEVTNGGRPTGSDSAHRAALASPRAALGAGEEVLTWRSTPSSTWFCTY